MEHQTIQSNGQRLHAVHCPAEHPWANLLLLHGYGDHAMRYADAMRWWASRGLSVHAVDFRGHGVSTGRRGAVRRWEDYLDDLAALLHHPPVRNASRPRFVLGHSHGALVALVAQLHGTLRADGLILSAPYLRPAHRVPLPKRLLAHLLNPILPSLRIANGLRGDWMTRDAEMEQDARQDTLLLHKATPRWFLRMRAMQQQIIARAGEIHLPLLMLHGTADQVADSSAGKEFLTAAASPDKTLKSYPDARHELLRDTHRADVYNDILQWIRDRAQGRG